LFNPENKIILNNIDINDITLNSNALIYSLYRDLIISNLDIQNIKCIDDNDKSSLIIFNSGALLQKMEISNSNVSNCLTNGPLISITGNDNEINIKDTAIDNNTSYGSGIMNSSSKVKKKIK